MARFATPRRHPRSLVPIVAALALLAAALPTAADAQLGGLRKLRKARPDSAALAAESTASRRDSARVAPADSARGGRSRLVRAASAAKKAADRIEAATGISATDAALIATGVGAPGLVARKLGVDPKAVVANALGSASANRAAAAQARPGTPAAGLSPADEEAMLAFQREMARVATAASAGDAAALARLEAWQAIVARHEPEIERLTLAASAGDVATLQKLQRVHLDMMREWSRGGTTARKPAPAPGARPRRP